MHAVFVYWQHKYICSGCITQKINRADSNLRLAFNSSESEKIPKSSIDEHNRSVRSQKDPIFSELYNNFRPAGSSSTTHKLCPDSNVDGQRSCKSPDRNAQDFDQKLPPFQEKNNNRIIIFQINTERRGAPSPLLGKKKAHRIRPKVALFLGKK